VKEVEVGVELESLQAQAVGVSLVRVGTVAWTKAIIQQYQQNNNSQ
jgi:hypothetical protein